MAKSKTPAYDAVKAEEKAEAKKPRIRMIPAFIKVRGKDEWISNPKGSRLDCGFYRTAQAQSRPITQGI